MRAAQSLASAPDRAQRAITLQGSVGNARTGHMLGPAVQTKLTGGGPDDVYEQEAKHTDDKVVRMGRRRPIYLGARAP